MLPPPPPSKSIFLGVGGGLAPGPNIPTPYVGVGRFRILVGPGDF